MINSKSLWRAIRSNIGKFSRKFWRFLGSDAKEYFEEFNISVTLSEEEAKIGKNILERIVNTPVKIFTSYMISEGIIVSVLGDKKKRSRIIRVGFILGEIPREKKKEQLIEKNKIKDELNTILNILLFDVIFNTVFPKNAYVFPTQRNSLMLDSIKRAIDRSSRKIIFEDKKTNIALMQFSEEYAYSRPLMDFLEMRDGVEIASKFKGRGELFKLAEDIERNLLKGKVVIEKGREIGTAIRFQLNDFKKLNLITSSSMVQQLSAIVLYLKYLAQPGDLVIIDEPESNLHPEAQLKFVEIIAKMINNGIWVIISTHTPYIVDHLNNLLTAYRLIQKANQQAIKEIPIPPECALDPNFVSAYLFKEDGTVKSIMEEQLINWETFGNVTEQLQGIYSRLIEIEEKINKE